MEEFRKIGRCPLYSISNFGNVRNDKTGRILKPGFQTSGYLQVHLAIDKDTFCHPLVHRLVAETFLENSNNYTEVDHIDMRKSNNHHLNLRWCSPTQNKRNVLKKPNCSSNYKGVSFDKKSNKWRATITLEGKQKVIGYFETPELARDAFRQTALENGLADFYPPDPA